MHYEGPKTSRVGWIDIRIRKIICHSCFDKNHIAPECHLKLYQFDPALRNYKALTADKSSMAHDNSYKNANYYLAIIESNTKEVRTDLYTERKRALLETYGQ